MTVTTSSNTVTATGDGVTAAFPFGRIFYENSHLKVYVAGVLKTITTHYTVSGASNPSGGTVTFTAGNIPANGASVVIQRIVSFDQQTDLENFDGNPSDVTEKQLDLIVMQTQQLDERLTRAVVAPVGTTLTFPSYGADKVLSWSSSVSGSVVNTGFTATQVQSAIDSVSALTAASGVKVSSNDTAAGFLNGKLVAGTGVSFTENNDGANETLTIAATTVTPSTATPALDDNISFFDTSDSGNVKKATAETIIRLILLDEDAMTSNSDTRGATQQSIKAYVDGIRTEGSTVNTTSGTSQDILSIPAGTTRIELMFSAVSLSGTANPLVQIGDSGGVETTGYTSASGTSDSTGTATSTSGFVLRSALAANTITGLMTLVLVESSTNTWAASYTFQNSGGSAIFGAGTKSLSAVLDRVRITSTGADTLDGGSVRAVYYRSA